MAKYTSEFGDTEGENTVRRDKENKRKRIIMGETLDLRGEMKVSLKLKENDSFKLGFQSGFLFKFNV